jgi:hypothetical protein
VVVFRGLALCFVDALAYLGPRSPAAYGRLHELGERPPGPIELLATGEKVRQRTVETRDDLTAQERRIAQLARDGLSNPEPEHVVHPVLPWRLVVLKAPVPRSSG